MPGPPLISIIIVSYNVRDLLMECIASIHAHLRFPNEIIVVDNDSDDGTAEEIKKRFSHVKLIANKNNPGFSAANNQGLAVSSGELVFFLNPDTAFPDDSIHAFIEAFLQSGEEKLISGPRLLNSDGSWQESCWKFPNPLHHLADLFFMGKLLAPSSYDPSSLQSKKEVDFVSGAALLTTSKNAKGLNGFDEILFWMEDVDICLRNNKAGGRNVFDPVASIIHYSGQSGKKNYRVQVSNQVISKLKFYRKHRQHFYFSISTLIFFLQIITRIPVFLVLSPINITFFKKCSAYTFTLSKFFQYLFLNRKSVT